MVTPEALLVAILAGLLFQHDTWLLAWLLGEEVEAKATSTDSFPNPDAGIRAERVAQVKMVSRNGILPSSAIRPSDHETSFSWTLASHGPSIAALLLHPHPIELDGAKFESYLRSEGRLDELGDRIQSRNRERYTKCAKAVPAGVKHEDTRGLRAGHPLEIVETDEGVVALLHGAPFPQCRLTEVSEPVQGLYGWRAHHVWPVESPDYEWESLWATLTYFR